MGKNEEKHSLWDSVKENIGYFLFLIPVEFIRLLSLKQAYKIAGAASVLAYYLDSKHRKRVITHMLHSGIVSTRKEAVILAKKNFLHLAKVFIEITKYDQIITKENYREHFKVDPEFYEANESILNPEKSEPAILVSMHIGNWELSANCYNYVSGHPICSIMRPLANRKIGDYFYQRRCNPDHQTISRNLGIKPLLSAMKEKKTVAIVADQHAGHNEGVEVRFFGHPARAHMTPALLHLKTGRPIMPGYVIRLDDDFHFLGTGGKPIRYTPTGDKEQDIRNITQAFTDDFERIVRKYPDQWLWAHRRWLDCGRHQTWAPDHFNAARESQNPETANNDRKA